MKVGIVGAGQLGQMLGTAGRRLDLDFLYLDPKRDPPARIAGPVLNYPFDSAAGLAELASSVDVLTYEFENVAVEAIDRIADTVPVFPPTAALGLAQDRLQEKRLFEGLGIPVAEYRTVDSAGDLREACASLGLPLVLKTRRLGYDGKGQRMLREERDVEAAYRELGGGLMLAERWIDFDREVSAIGARSASGATVFYPITENLHRDGILLTSRAPDRSTPVADRATRYLAGLLEHLNYVGVLALELFVKGDLLFANEFAPRVHNSGHWTIEGAVTSQFENHLRAILGMPLGDAAAVGHAGMINLIGTIPPLPAMDGRVFVHDYGKTARPGRKLGHITVITDSAADRDAKLAEIAAFVSGNPPAMRNTS